MGASLVTLWKQWLGDFEIVTGPVRIEVESRKHALLLYHAASQVRETFGQLETTCDTAKSKLNDYF